MIQDHEWICPLCGAVLPSLTPSLTHFHRHYAKVHQSKPPAVDPDQAASFSTTSTPE